jgi:acetylornithine deacetylase/succinyl-diaminopimelate desuccinylase-like protein
LVAIPTENPPGRAYDDCVERIVAVLDALGLEREIVETGEPGTPRRALVASTEGHGPLLYLHGHYDVVPAFSPGQFEPRVEDGRLIGRGAADMKGGLAAIVHAARVAADRGARVGLVIVPDEETGRSGRTQCAVLRPAYGDSEGLDASTASSGRRSTVLSAASNKWSCTPSSSTSSTSYVAWRMRSTRCSSPTWE